MALFSVPLEQQDWEDGGTWLGPLGEEVVAQSSLWDTGAQGTPPVRPQGGRGDLSG